MYSALLALALLNSSATPVIVTLNLTSTGPIAWYINLTDLTSANVSENYSISYIVVKITKINATNIPTTYEIIGPTRSYVNLNYTLAEAPSLNIAVTTISLNESTFGKLIRFLKAGWGLVAPLTILLGLVFVYKARKRL